MIQRSHLAALGVAVSVAPAALAGVHLVPSTNVTPDPNNPTVWKTVPLANGQTITIEWTVHTKNMKEHWAGVRFRSHVLDPSEVDLLGVTLYPGLLPQQTLVGPFPGSSGIQATWWDPSATGSGVDMPSSVVFNFGRWTIMAHNTTPAGNSDVDLSAWASSILHLGSGTITLFPSWYVWATSNFVPTPTEPFPENPPFPGEPFGHWHHIDFTAQAHPTPFQASGFVAKPIGGAGLGIEHIPAPGVGLAMLAGGGLAILAGKRSGRRRPA